MSTMQYPKVEAYDGYLYVVLHGIAVRGGRTLLCNARYRLFRRAELSRDRAQRRVRSIAELRDHATRNAKILAEGPVALFHRIVDAMVDHYRPEVEKLEEPSRRDREQAIFADPHPRLVAIDPAREERRVVASPHHHAAARRHRAAGAARLRRRQHRDVVSVSRHLRSSRPHRRRCAAVPGSHHRHARCAPVEREQPAERSDEGADGRRHHLHALDAVGRHFRHERAAAASFRAARARSSGGWSAILLAVIVAMLSYFRRQPLDLTKLRLKPSSAGFEADLR